MPGPSKPWKKGDPVSAGRLEAMRAEAVTEIRVGPGLTVQRVGNAVVISKAPDPPILGTVRVKITSNAAGGGKYNARIIGTGGAVNPATNLSEADLGIVSDADNCYALYPPEVDTSDHSLTDAANIVHHFIGLYGSPATDGRPTVVIAGVGLGNC